MKSTDDVHPMRISKKSTKKPQLHTVRIGLTGPTDDLLVEVCGPIAKLLRTDPVKIEHRVIVAAIHSALRKYENPTIAQEVDEELQRHTPTRAADQLWQPWEIRVEPYTYKRLSDFVDSPHKIDFCEWAVARYLLRCVGLSPETVTAAYEPGRQAQRPPGGVRMEQQPDPNEELLAWMGPEDNSNVDFTRTVGRVEEVEEGWIVVLELVSHSGEARTVGSKAFEMQLEAVAYMCRLLGYGGAHGELV
jgi:hypothetical protein